MFVGFHGRKRASKGWGITSTYLVKIPRVLWSASVWKKGPLQWGRQGGVPIAVSRRGANAADE